MFTNNKFKAQTSSGNPAENSCCHVLASYALNISLSFDQSVRSIESRSVVKKVTHMSHNNDKCDPQCHANEDVLIVVFCNAHQFCVNIYTFTWNSRFQAFHFVQQALVPDYVVWLCRSRFWKRFTIIMINTSWEVFIDVGFDHDDVIKWKHFPRYYPFSRGIHRWIPLTKASDAALWCFLWSAPE